MRELCEFTAKRGDLDRRFTPSATALEGLIGPERGGGPARPGLRDRDRAGGHAAARCACAAAPTATTRARRCLEEIKTIRGHPDEIPENRRQLHWAQLQTYGALFCRARGLAEIALALVYFDVASADRDRTAPGLRRRRAGGRSSRSAAQRFLAWARQEAAHRAARDAALKALAFPQATFRAGQRDLAEAVYRHGRQRALPAGPGAHRHRQDRGHAVPAAARHARRRASTRSPT